MAKYTFPIPSDCTYNYSSSWGAPRDGGNRKHKGNDIMAEIGTPAVALCDAIFSQSNQGYHVGGGYIYKLKELDSSTFHYYMHMREGSSISDGTQVSKGQLVGYVGNTGNAYRTSGHIHYELHPDGGAAVDPHSFLQSIDSHPSSNGGKYDPDNASPTTGLGSGSGSITDLNSMNFPGYDLPAVAMAEVYKGIYQLAISQPILDSIKKAAEEGIYTYCTDGQGRFIARWADYFGEEQGDVGLQGSELTGAHFEIDEMEITGGQVSVNDQNLVTHQFVLGDWVVDGDVNKDDWLASIGESDELRCGYCGFDLDRVSGMQAQAWTTKQFVERYGFRPAKEEIPIFRYLAQMQFMAEYLLRLKWADNTTGQLQTTFLPEVRPMMIVKIPKWNMQFYVDSATHSFGPKFSSSINLKAGLFLDAENGSRNPFCSKIDTEWASAIIDDKGTHEQSSSTTVGSTPSDETSGGFWENWGGLSDLFSSRHTDQNAGDTTPVPEADPGPSRDEQ